MLLDCYESLLPTAKTTLYLPIIAEKFARERLNAIGRTEGSIPSLVPGVLFLCVQNAGRSQMAAGWLRHLARDSVVVWSGGSEPASEVNPGCHCRDGRGRNRHNCRVPQALER